MSDGLDEKGPLSGLTGGRVPVPIRKAWRSAGESIGLEYSEPPPALTGRVGPCSVEVRDVGYYGMPEMLARVKYPIEMTGFVIERRKHRRRGRYEVPLADPALADTVKVTWEKVDRRKPDVDRISMFLSEPKRREALQVLYTLPWDPVVEHLSTRSGVVKLRGPGGISLEDPAGSIRAVLDPLVQVGALFGLA